MKQFKTKHTPSYTYTQHIEPDRQALVIHMCLKSRVSHSRVSHAHIKQKTYVRKNNKIQSDVVKQPHKQIKSNFAHAYVYE